MAISGTDKLRAYNGALRRVGSRRLASLSENRAPRRWLDDAWGADDNAVRACLQKGEWNFATRSVAATPSDVVEPQFGFTYAYPKPADFVRLVDMCADAELRLDLSDDEFVDEAGYWFSNQGTLYIRYVSDDPSYGFDSSKWDESFAAYLEAYLASEIVLQVNNSNEGKALAKREEKDALAAARSADAMNEGPKFLASGSWVRSRRGRWDTEQGR